MSAGRNSRRLVGPDPRALLTGERTAPGIPDEAYWFTRHEAAYRWAIGQMAGFGRACDAGSGEGYGTALLGQGARFACGMELDDIACRHAAASYPEPVVRANLVALPLRGCTFDLVTSMQVIEHMWDTRAYLDELHRILRPEGTVVITTPNRLVFSPGLERGQRPTNPFHVEEFDAEQLEVMLAGAGFTSERVLGLHHGPRLADWEARNGSMVEALVTAINAGAMPEALLSFITTLTWEDFAIADAADLPIDASADLIAIGQRG